MADRLASIMEVFALSLNKQEKMDVAMFRYGLIAPVLQHTVDDPGVYLDDLVGRVHDVPHYGPRQYSRKTIQRWIVAYRRENLDGLLPQVRQDKAVPRTISPDMAEGDYQLPSFTSGIYGKAPL